MLTVLYFSVLLLLGLLGSQLLPGVVGPAYAAVGDGIRVLTMVGLSFIMIRVGYEFDIDKSNLRQYGWDYAVAFTAASFSLGLRDDVLRLRDAARRRLGNPGRLARDAARGSLRRADLRRRAVLHARRRPVWEPRGCFARRGSSRSSTTSTRCC